MAIQNLVLLPQLDLQARLRIDHLPFSEIERLRGSSAIVAEPTRQRPLYFDGRFLAARDLERDQRYFLARQSDLGRAAGAGVVSGLLASATDNFRITIEPGIGITPSGELVVLIPPAAQDVLTLNLADIAGIQELDAAFGLLDSPREPARNRSGLFILALRPVEYTANPIGAYPTAIDERRKVMDGEVIEATAVVLVPVRDPGFEGRPAQQRALAARRIFIESQGAADVADVVPIAILQLETGFLRWLDPFLVRREIGAEHASVGPFGASARASREAFLLQYQAQLTDVLAERQAAGSSPRFAASDVFRALPPAGPLPGAAVDLNAMTQLWFPPGMQVAYMNVAEDELTALIEESILLPPIDLQAPAAQLAQISVLILAPTPRADLSGGGDPSPRVLSSAMPFALPSAVNVLRLLSNGGFQRLRLPRIAPPTDPVVAPGTASDDTPADPGTVEVAGPTPPEMCWYVRRRLRHVQPDATVIAASSGS